MGSILEEPEFEYTKNSLLEIDEKNRQFAIDIIDYVNDTSYAEDDEFFYDMLEFVRFNTDVDIAATDPQGLIYLNPPHGLKITNWDFIYSHECMHQLWDTFEVGDRIKAKGIEYNHELLNIASDCVINDYLKFYRGKDMPNIGITPQSIEETFGVVYDRRKDTQFTLYLKILKSGKSAGSLSNQGWGDEKIKPKRVQKGGGPTPPPPPGGEPSPDFVKGWTDGIKDVLAKKVDPKRFKPLPGNGDYEKGYNAVMAAIKKGMEEGITISENGGDKGGSKSGGLPQIPWDMDDDKKKSGGGKGSGESEEKSPEQEAQEAQDAADKAQDAANKAKKTASKSNSQAAKDAADKAQEAAKKAQEAAKKAAKAASKGDAKEAHEQAQEAKSEAAKAIGAAAEAESHDESNQGESDSDDRGSKDGEWSKTFEKEQMDISKIKAKHDAMIKKAANKITGDLGEFIKKCEDSKNLEGLETKTNRAMEGWGRKAFKAVDAYIWDTWGNPRWEPTYKKFNKKQGIPKMGDMLMKGKRKIQDKFNLRMNFFVDRSGSMDSGQPKRIENACEAMYDIARGLKKNWTNTETIDKVDFGFYTWGTGPIAQISMGQVPKANDGTDNMDVLIDKIIKGKYMANVNFIITDGETEFPESQMADLLEDSPDMWVIVSISTSSRDIHQSLMSKYKNYAWIPCSNTFE